MKIRIRTLQLLAALTATIAAPWSASSATFSYSYQSVFDANAEAYIVDLQNVKKYSEWQDPPVTYWGPSANDLPGTVTMRFGFSDATSGIHLNARLISASWLDAGRADYGYSSLWGSRDGASWQLLLDVPTPTGPGAIGSDVIYNQDVPASLLGGTEFWLQARLWTHASLVNGVPAATSWADAQFSRYDPNNPTGMDHTFEMAVTTVPEPGVVPLAALAALALGWSGRKRSL